MEKSIHLDDFIVITDSISEVQDNYFIKEKNNTLAKLEKLEKQNKELTELLEKQNKELQRQREDYSKLKKRHTELLKMMNELLKIKPSQDEVDNLDEIRDKIIKTLYNELRRHTVLPFTAMIGNYTHSFKQPDL